jgi:hypothetical protein
VDGLATLLNGAAQLNQAAPAAREAFDRAARASIPHPYVLRDGCIWKACVNRDGIPLDARITTFAAAITGEVIRVRKNAVNREALTRAQHDAAQGLFAQAEFGFIVWLARDRPKHVEWYQERTLKLRAAFQDEAAHPRTAPAMAGKMAALELAIEFACDSGAISDEQAADFLVRFETALKKLAQVQNPDYAAMQPAARFVRLLRDALASGRGHITTRSGAAPPAHLAAGCGWKGFDGQANNGGRLESSGPNIGWIDGRDWEDLFLNPSESLAVVQKLARDMQQPFNIGERDLHQYLFEDDFLVWDKQARSEKESRDSLTVRKSRLGIRLPVLHLWTRKILDVEDDE